MGGFAVVLVVVVVEACLSLPFETGALVVASLAPLTGGRSLGGCCLDEGLVGRFFDGESSFLGFTGLGVVVLEGDNRRLGLGADGGRRLPGGGGYDEGLLGGLGT
uniref:Secreted protein n=1 Tax=Tetranychus urticae TaxID=32264 RepID=T1L4Y5_TETUR